MQGRKDTQRGYLDVEALAGELLAPGSVFAFLARNRRRLFQESMMEDLFLSQRGRPSVPAPVIGSVLVLQALLMGEPVGNTACAKVLKSLTEDDRPLLVRRP